MDDSTCTFRVSSYVSKYNFNEIAFNVLGSEPSSSGAIVKLDKLFAIRRGTEEQTKKMFEEADKLCLRWQSGERYIETKQNFDPDTCFLFSDGQYGKLSDFIRFGYTILSFENLVFKGENSNLKMKFVCEQ